MQLNRGLLCWSLKLRKLVVYTLGFTWSYTECFLSPSSFASRSLTISKFIVIQLNAFAGKKMLVPLTASLYASGTLSNADSVLVDVGTGYYIEVCDTEIDAYTICNTFDNRSMAN